MLSWKYSQIFLRIHIIVNIGEKLSWTMPPDVYLFPCCPRREEVLNVTTQKRKSVLFVDNWGIWCDVMNWWCCLIVEQPTLSSCPECVAFASINPSQVLLLRKHIESYHIAEIYFTHSLGFYVRQYAMFSRGMCCFHWIPMFAHFHLFPNYQTCQV